MHVRKLGHPDARTVVCADVLGAFGVSACDLERRLEDRPDGDDGQSADEAARVLEALLGNAVDPTSVLRRTIAVAERGIELSTCYEQEALADRLTRTFEAVGWSCDAEVGVAGVYLEVTDDGGRRRRATITYPDTPLDTYNLPAALHAVNERVLYGANARFVLLAHGPDRWRAGLVDAERFDDLRDRFGERVAPFERPLLPERGLQSFVPGHHGSPIDDWPAWVHSDSDPKPSPHARPRAEPSIARSRIDRSSASRSPTQHTSTDRSDTDRPSGRRSGGDRERSDSGAEGTSSAGTPSYDGYELVGGPTTARRATASRSTSFAPNSDESGRSGPTRSKRSGPGSKSESTGLDRPPTSTGNDQGSGRDDASDFGSLSGTVKTARVSNDSFGADVERPSEDDRYRALGVAIGSGKNVSVKGLLDDEEFLPRLPAVEPTQTRIEFDDDFDPGAVGRAKGVAEESGFVWVDSGSLETRRVSE